MVALIGVLMISSGHLNSKYYRKMESKGLRFCASGAGRLSDHAPLRWVHLDFRLFSAVLLVIRGHSKVCGCLFDTWLWVAEGHVV